VVFEGLSSRGKDLAAKFRNLRPAMPIAGTAWVLLLSIMRELMNFMVF